MQLVRYEAARNALSIASSVDEVEDIRDKAQAMAAYARQANDTELVEWATEIKVRAERRAGEMIVEMEKHPAGRPTKNQSHPATNLPPTLKQLGISKTQSSRWQKIAAIPEEKFEQAVAAAKEFAGEVTTAAMLRVAKGEPHVSHNSGENEWYTPPEFIESARSVMGGIDCDPASSAIANRAVKAETYYTEKQNGLTHKWNGCVWMNPPYAQPLCSQFCAAVTEKYKSGEIKQACVLVNNATETIWFQQMLEMAAAVCFLKGRVKFVDTQGNPAGAPLQGQAVLYFGSKDKKFSTEFAAFGIVLGHPARLMRISSAARAEQIDAQDWFRPTPVGQINLQITA